MAVVNDVSALPPAIPSAIGGDVGSGAADLVLAGAAELARSAADYEAGTAVGAHLGVRREGDDLSACHSFAADLPGYRGWYWAVIVSRVPDSAHVTVDEVVLLPGGDALLAPAWVPWNERLRPGDLAPGDLLPTAPDDERLVPGYVFSDDPAVEEVAFELGLGRERVFSREGRLDTADRWSDSDYGPAAPMARQAPANCGTCGFFLPLAGSLRAGFGACGNQFSNADGRVVSVEYGCGAHSQALVELPPLSEPLLGPVYDDGEQLEAGSLAADSRGSSEPTGSADDSSDGATLGAVPVHDGVTDQAEDPAGEAGPEPEAVMVSTEPAVEGQ
ncbi:MAG: DUF3027 domain-containing protein [Actinobacteria bacterium]|nr:DUF3027 domain-containing protein [Actinomycetota bacterium]